MKFPALVPRFILASPAALVLGACAQTGDVRIGDAATGSDVLSDGKSDAPGRRLHIGRSDVPAPQMGNEPEKPIAGNVRVVAPTVGAVQHVPTALRRRGSQSGSSSRCAAGQR